MTVIAKRRGKSSPRKRQTLQKPSGVIGQATPPLVAPGKRPAHVANVQPAAQDAHGHKVVALGVGKEPSFAGRVVSVASNVALQWPTKTGSHPMLSPASLVKRQASGLGGHAALWR